MHYVADLFLHLFMCFFFSELYVVLIQDTTNWSLLLLFLLLGIYTTNMVVYNQHEIKFALIDLLNSISTQPLKKGQQFLKCKLSNQ